MVRPKTDHTILLYTKYSSCIKTNYISAFHYYLATPKFTQLHSRICLIWENVKWKTSLNLKYEPKVLHKDSRLEVCFQLV